MMLLAALALDLHMALFGPGVAPCDGIPRYGFWSNQHSQTIYLRKVKVWIGVSYGAIVDTGVSLTLDGGVQRTLIAHAQDRYGNPDGPQDVWYDFTPDYVAIQPGHWLSLRGACLSIRWWDGAIMGDPRAIHEPNVQLFYTLEKP